MTKLIIQVIAIALLVLGLDLLIEYRDTPDFWDINLLAKLFIIWGFLIYMKSKFPDKE